MRDIPRDALMAFEDACFGGDHIGRMRSASYALDHRSRVAGQNKHFAMNEAFHEALAVHGGEPSSLSRSCPVIGRFGIFSIARLNLSGHEWSKLARAGVTRKRLAELNVLIRRKYVQPDLFVTGVEEVHQGAVFIVGLMDGLDANKIPQLTQVMIAVPDPDLKGFLYIKPLREFIQLYDQAQVVAPIDAAIPKLKVVPKKQTDND